MKLNYGTISKLVLFSLLGFYTHAIPEKSLAEVNSDQYYAAENTSDTSAIDQTSDYTSDTSAVGPTSTSAEAEDGDAVFGACSVKDGYTEERGSIYGQAYGFLENLTEAKTLANESLAKQIAERVMGPGSFCTVHRYLIANYNTSATAETPAGTFCEHTGSGAKYSCKTPPVETQCCRKLFSPRPDYPGK